MADNLDHARAAPPKRGRTEGAQVGFLDGVLGVVLISQQPAREVVRGVQVRQESLVKILRISIPGHLSLHGSAARSHTRFGGPLCFARHIEAMDGLSFSCEMHIPS
jgi:hypothetical protein